MHRCHDATSSTNRTPARARKHHRRHDSLAGVQAELDTAHPHTAWPLLGGKPQLIARLRLTCWRATRCGCNSAALRRSAGREYLCVRICEAASDCPDATHDACTIVDPKSTNLAQRIVWAVQASRATNFDAPVEDEQSSLRLAKGWEHAFPQELAASHCRANPITTAPAIAAVGAFHLNSSTVSFCA